MAEDWEQYYSGFSPVAGAPVNTGTALQNTYYAPAATYAAPQGNYAPQPVQQPQQTLLPYQGSYSELRGWNPDPMAANNSGPALQGGDWGGLVSNAYQYPDQAQQQAPAPSPYGSLPSYQDWLGFNKGTDTQQYRDIYKSTMPGGDYNDMDNAPYNPAGGADLLSGNQFAPSPYGDLSGSQFAQSNPYGDLSGVTPNPYGDMSGVPAMQPPSPYGNLSNSQPQNSYGDLSGNTIDPMAGFQGSYPPPAQQKPSYNDWLSLNKGTDSAQYQSIYRNTVDSSFQNPAQSYQTPTTSQTFGGLEPAFNAMSDRDMQGFDQTYMDQPQGSYGSLLGAGGDMPPSYETPGGSPLAPPTQPVNTGYQAPTQSYQTPTTPSTFGDMSGSQNVATGGAQLPSYQNWLALNKGTDNSQYQDIYKRTVGPMVMPSSQDSASSAGPMPASQQFASGMGSTFGSQMPSPDFGGLNLNFQPMPGASGTKIADRAPQLGGFVSYGAQELPQPAQPSQPQAMQAITKALNPDTGGWDDWWKQQQANGYDR